MVGASGSSKSIASFHALVPAAAPRWLRSVERNSAFDASAPPPAPKIEPMNAVDRDDVVDRRRRLVDAVRLVVGGDAVGLGLHLGDHLPALGAVGVDDALHLVGDELLGRRARHERLPARDEAERVDAGDVGHRGARRAATELEQQAAVAGGDPAGAEREVGAGLAGDVGDAVGVVEDRGAGPAGRLLVRRADRLEVLGQVVAVDVGVGDVARAAG